jgi:SAM-dependent methyltransferase
MAIKKNYIYYTFLALFLIILYYYFRAEHIYQKQLYNEQQQIENFEDMMTIDDKYEDIYDKEFVDFYEIIYRDFSDIDYDLKIVKEKTLNNIKNKEQINILVCGCGVGKLCKKLKDNYDSVIGVDISANEIERLKELYPEHIFILRMVESANDFVDLISAYQPDFIKMDIEGAEIHLKDVPKEVFSSVKEFAIEYHNPECKKVIMDKFNELDFEITALNSFGYYQTDSNIMGIIHSKKK